MNKLWNILRVKYTAFNFFLKEPNKRVLRGGGNSFPFRECDERVKRHEGGLRRRQSKKGALNNGIGDLHE